MAGIGSFDTRVDEIDPQRLDDCVRRNFDGVDGVMGLGKRCAIFHRHVFQQAESTWEWQSGVDPTGEAVWVPYDAVTSAAVETAWIRKEARVDIGGSWYVDLKSPERLRQCRVDDPSRRRAVPISARSHPDPTSPIIGEYLGWA